MFGMSPAVHVHIATTPADMRKSFDGLATLAKDTLDLDPFSGYLLVFANRRRDRLKVLYWDRHGFAVWANRLERGTSRIPAAIAGRVEMTAADLAALALGDEEAGEVLGEMAALALVGEEVSIPGHGVLDELKKLDDAWHEPMLRSPTAPGENRAESTPFPLF
jgi:transposase